MTSDERYWMTEYRRLVGKTVVDIKLDSDGFFALVFTTGEEAWIASDPELNSPGTLEIRSEEEEINGN